MAAPDRYRVAAPIYDLATAIWSGGAIWRSRRAALNVLSPGASLLVPGPGSGRLVAEAARRGAIVTAVERSPSMRARLTRRLAALEPEERARVRVIAADLDAFRSEHPAERFDVVAAEHFLNVFAPPDMPRVRDTLLSLTRPRGRLVIADFAPLAGAAPTQALQRLHHIVPLGGCALLTQNAMHPIYDHGSELLGHPLVRSIRREEFRVHRIGPRWFATWTVERTDEPFR